MILALGDALPGELFSTVFFGKFLQNPFGKSGGTIDVEDAK
jgi:hypothetical protein